MQCWQTASLCGAAFAGKLKPLRHYLKDEKKAAAPHVGREEFERRLKLAEKGGREDGSAKT